MPMTFQQTMDLVNWFTAEDLEQLSSNQVSYIISGLTEPQILEFIFAKNIKIYGGINGYAEVFLSRGTITKMKGMPNGTARALTIQGALQSLHKILTYDELSEGNRAEINEAIIELTNNTAPAAGGYRRKNKRSKNRTKRKLRTRSK